MPEYQTYQRDNSLRRPRRSSPTSNISSANQNNQPHTAYSPPVISSTWPET